MNSTSETPLAVSVSVIQNPRVGTEVPAGCTISSIYLSVYILGSTGASSGLVDWYIWKNPGGTITGAEAPIPSQTGQSNVRRFIFHEEKGLYASQDGTPMVFKGVIKIPPRFRRMGQGDQLAVKIRSPEDGGTFCIKAIYKYYT